MSFVVQAELMKNQQAANLQAAGKDFSAIQTSKGYAVFFTIASDNKFNAIREISHDKAYSLGWQRVDLTPPGVTEIIDFAIAQNPQTLQFDIALAGIMGGRHTLWIAPNNSADIFTTFKDGAIPWQEKAPPTEVKIAKLYIMNMFEGTQKVQMIYVDVYRNQDQFKKLIERYLINPSEQQPWSPRSMGADFFAGSMRTCVGRPQNEVTAGVYTFGIVNTSQQLIYQPSMLGRALGHTGNISRLVAPPNSLSIASAPAKDENTTNLFVAAKDGLYLFKPDNQFDGAQPVKIFDAASSKLTSLLFSDITKMTARWMGDKVTLFILNAKQQLFYTRCTMGQESITSSWQMPVSICSRVQDYAFFVDTETASGDYETGNVVFAETTDNKLVVLNQNLSTGIWNTSYILLPTSEAHIYHERTTFTAQVKVLDTQKQPLPNQPVNITASSHMTAFIDGVYYSLDPEVPAKINSKADGTIVIVQDTDSLAAASFTLDSKITISGNPLGSNSVGSNDKSGIHNQVVPFATTVDPTTNAYVKLGEAQTADGIKKVQLQDSSGTVRPLIPNGSNTDSLATDVSSNVKALLEAKTLLATQQTQQPSNQDSRDRRSWDLLGNIIPIGDLVQLVKDGLEVVKDGIVTGLTTVGNFVVQQVGKAWHVILKIAGDTWSALLDTAQAVGDAVVAVFNAVKTGFSNLISWLGFLFAWDDIKRTHNFLVKVMGLYIESIIDGIDGLITKSTTSINDIATRLENLIDPKITGSKNVDNIFKNKQKVGTVKASDNTSDDLVNSPQANWGTQKLSEHGSNATVEPKDVPTAPTAVQATSVNSKVTALKVTTDSHEATISQKLKTFQEDVLNNILELDPLILVKKTAVLCIEIVKSVGTTIITSVLRLVKEVISDIYKAFKTPIKVPIISGLYSTYIAPGHELSVMDVSCLILAVPATVMYKAVTQQAPFPNADSELYKKAMSATKWGGFKDSIKPPPKRTPAQTSRKSVKRGEYNYPPYIVLQIFANMLGTAGTLLLTVISIYKTKSTFSLTKAVVVAGIGAYIAYVAPNIMGLSNDPGNHWNIANDIFTIVAVCKSSLDFGLPYYFSDGWGAKGSWSEFWDKWVSPIFESVLNFGWLIVLLGGFITGDHSATAGLDWTLFLANMCFDFSGILTVLTQQHIMDLIFSPVVGENIVKGAAISIVVLNGLYGLLCFIATFAIDASSFP